MDFPVELQEKSLQLHNALEEISTLVKKLNEHNPQEMRDKLTPLEKAKFDLVCAYMLNSLFWMYLNSKGENPYNHGIKKELERIQSYMVKVKAMMDKCKAPKLDVDGAKRFLRNSLWTPKQKPQEHSSSEVEIIEEVVNEETKRKSSSDEKKKRKKHRKK